MTTPNDAAVDVWTPLYRVTKPKCFCTDCIYTRRADEMRQSIAAIRELVEAAKVASFAMADAADSDFMGDSYHEAIASLRAALRRFATGGE